MATPKTFETQADVNEFLREPVQFGEDEFLVMALDTATDRTANLEVARQMRRYAEQHFGEDFEQQYDYDGVHVGGLKTIPDPDETDGSQALAVTYDHPAPFAAWVASRK